MKKKNDSSIKIDSVHQRLIDAIAEKAGVDQSSVIEMVKGFCFGVLVSDTLGELKINS